MLLTVNEFETIIGEPELLQIAGTGSREERARDEDKIMAALTFAEGIVNGYVRDRYPLILNGENRSAILQGFAADIARHRLRGQGGQQAAMNDVVQARHDEAIARLKDIAAGRLTLDFPSEKLGDAPRDLAIHVATPAQRRDGVLSGFIP